MAFRVITNKKIESTNIQFYSIKNAKPYFLLQRFMTASFAAGSVFCLFLLSVVSFIAKSFFYIIKFNDIPCQFSTVSHCIVCCQKHFIGWSNEEIFKKTEQQKTREKKREKRTITTSWYNKLLILFTVQRCFYLSQLILCCSSWADVFVVVALKQTKIVIDKRRIFSTDSIWNRNSLGFKSKRKCKCTYFLTES